MGDEPKKERLKNPGLPKKLRKAVKLANVQRLLKHLEK